MADEGVIHVASYRDVFDLERKIHSAEGHRLPYPIPVRLLVYTVVIAVAGVQMSLIPGVSAVANFMPWWARLVVVPAVLAFVLYAGKLSGRAVHTAVWPALGHLLAPKATVRFRPVGAARFHPAELVFLPDGRERRPRRLRVHGPATLELACHFRGGRLRAKAGRRRRRALVVDRLQTDVTRRRVTLRAGAALEVIPGRLRGKK